MTENNRDFQEYGYRNGHGRAVFTGVLLGGLTGAITALLFAPKSGQETRHEIKSKVTEVRARAGERLEGTVGQIRDKAQQIKTDVGSKAKELKHQGQEVLAEQLDRVSAAAEAGKRNLQGNQS